jgi:ABC-type polysaccharide/polyol phosphate transport system ATPase subunit
VLNEILTVGDQSLAAKCLNRMERFKEMRKTIVLVTHDANLVVSWFDLALRMDRGASDAPLRQERA